MIRWELANWLNNKGMGFDDAGKKAVASILYSSARIVDPSFSPAWYNLGLQAKYAKKWRDSLQLNKQAVRADSKNEGAWWNLGIAATAVHDWDEARRAWQAYGIDLSTSSGEVLMPSVRACVRLDPGGSGEVVWGLRLDPARTVILSVPLPESGHRFHDIILNDGAQSGTRTDEDGCEVPVFNELEVWEKSSYSTFEAHIKMPDEAALDSLAELCDSRKLGIEDWGTVRVICATCSSGSLEPHEHQPAQNDQMSSFAFGAKSYDELMMTLTQWSAEIKNVELGHVEMVLDAS